METKRILLSLAFLVALCTTLTSRWVMTPIVNYVAEPRLVSVQELQFHFWSLRLQIKGLVAGEGDSALTLDKLNLDADWGFLTGEATRVDIQLGQLKTGYEGDTPRIAGLSIEQWQQRFQPAADSNAPAPPQTEENPSGPLPHILLNTFKIKRIELQPEKAGWPGAVIQNVSLSNLNLRAPEQLSSLALQLKTAEGRIDLTGDIAPLSLATEQTLALKIKTFRPDHRWLHFVPEAWQGEINAQLNLKGRVSDSVTLQTNGTLALSELSWQTDAQQVTLNRFALTADQIDLSIDTKNKDRLPEVQFTGQVELAELDAKLKGETQTQRLELGSLAIRNLQLQTAPEGNNLKGLPVSACLDLQTRDLALTDASGNVALAGLDIQKIALNKNLTVDAMTLDQFSVSSDMLDYQLKTLTGDNLNISEQNAQLNIVLDRLALNAGQGVLTLPPEKTERPTEKAEQPTEKTPQPAEITDAGAVTDTPVTDDKSVVDNSPSSEKNDSSSENTDAPVIPASITLNTFLLSDHQLRTESSQPEQQIELNLGALSLNNFALAPYTGAGKPLAAAQINTDLMLRQFDLKRMGQQAQFEQLSLNGIHLSDHLSLDATALKQLNINADALKYQLSQLDVKQLKVKPADKTRIAVADIAVGEGKMNLVLPKKEQAEPEQPVNEQTPDTAEIQTDTADNQTANTGQTINKDQDTLAIELGSLAISKQTLHFQDNNLKEPVQTELLLEHLTLKQLDTSDTQAAIWSMDAWLDGQSHWLFDGTFLPSPLTITTKGKLNNLNLPEISGYSQHYADITFEQGVMDSDIELTWKQDQLKGSIDFLMHRLDMSLGGPLSVKNAPLQMALSVLRDSDDTIRLPVSVDKERDDLKVGTGPLITEFLMGASKKGALAYFKLLLQPYGALLTLADLSGSLLKGDGMSLDPIRFKPLASQLTAEQSAYAQKLIALMKQKQELKLESCEQHSAREAEMMLAKLEGDEEQLPQALLELRQDRIRAWRRLFAEAELGGRILACKAETLTELSESQYAIKLVP